MDDLLELTSRAEATHFWFQGFRGYVRPVIDDLAAGCRDLRIVDCGCGTGHNLRLLRPYGRAVGFDLTRGGLVRARANGHAVARGDVTRAPFADASFDLATSFDVLQCVERDDLAMREMARIVRPGGAVLVTVAAFEALRGDHAEVWGEFRRYVPGSVRALLEGAGLSVVRLSFMFASLFPLMLAVRAAQRLLRPIRPARADADIAVPAAPVNTALAWLVRSEAVLARRVPMPLGSSILAVGRKP